MALLAATAVLGPTTPAAAAPPGDDTSTTGSTVVPCLNPRSFECEPWDTPPDSICRVLPMYCWNGQAEPYTICKIAPWVCLKWVSTHSPTPDFPLPAEPDFSFDPPPSVPGLPLSDER